MQKFLFLATALLSTQVAFSQPDSLDAEGRYQWRLTQTKLNGVYIPKDLNDAFSELSRLIEAPSKQKFKTALEEVVKHKLHFSLGQWMMVNWGFYEGSRLTAFLNELGLYHPDDMARFLIVSYHRSLNRTSLDVRNLVTELSTKRDSLRRDRLLQGEVIYEEVRKVPRDSLEGDGSPD
ncbi:MAG: DUF6794 domain-containing protein [Bacteroidota bacterium]